MDVWEVVKVLLAIAALMLILNGLLALVVGNLRGLKFRRPQFSLQTLLLAFVVVWSSMATFGPGGIILAAILLAIVAFMRSSESMLHALPWVAVVIVLLPCVLGLLFSPLIPTVRESGRRASCLNNLKQIALALHNYKDDHGSFPLAYVTGPDGKPWHSWRVLILPYVEEQALYNQYDFNEPWNGPNNSKLAANTVRLFTCPSDPTSWPPIMTNYIMTNYVAVVGDAGAWPGARGRKLDEFWDGKDQTIMLVEVANSGINWMEPRDMSWEEAMAGIVAPGGKGISSYHVRDNGFFFHPTPSVNVAFADGSVRFLPQGVAPSTLRSLLTINGGEMVDLSALDTPGREPNWTRIIGLIALVASVAIMLLRPRPKPAAGE